MLLLYQVMFKIVVFSAWLSVVFNIAGKIWKEEVLFASLKSAIILYVISIIIAIILSCLSFILFYMII